MTWFPLSRPLGRLRAEDDLSTYLGPFLQQRTDDRPLGLYQAVVVCVSSCQAQKHGAFWAMDSDMSHHGNLKSAERVLGFMALP